MPAPQAGDEGEDAAVVPPPLPQQGERSTAFSLEYKMIGLLRCFAFGSNARALLGSFLFFLTEIMVF